MSEADPLSIDRRNRLLSRMALILLLLWLLTGLFVVQVDEQAVVRRFGAVVAERVPPGLHLGFPWGIDRVDRVRVREQKRLNVGFEFPDPVLGRPAAPASREFLTGDQNLINIELLVQYTVREPRAYLFSNEDVIQTLRAAAEAGIVTTVAGRPVDLLLTTGRLEAQSQLRRSLQESADRYRLGISVSSVNIQSITPPLKVADAFREVASAREDRDRIIKEAESYANATLPAAEGEASRMHEESYAYRDQKIRQARGDADRFLKAYSAYRLAPDITSSRLYLETIEEILPRLKVVHQEGNTPVDLNLLPRPSGSAGSPAPNGGSNGQSAPPPASSRP
jgi:membrane protease subunit HflK